jgi:hypothetical protein
MTSTGAAEATIQVSKPHDYTARGANFALIKTRAKQIEWMNEKISR